MGFGAALGVDAQDGLGTGERRSMTQLLSSEVVLVAVYVFHALDLIATKSCPVLGLTVVYDAGFLLVADVEIPALVVEAACDFIDLVDEGGEFFAAFPAHHLDEDEGDPDAVALGYVSVYCDAAAFLAAYEYVFFGHDVADVFEADGGDLVGELVVLAEAFYFFTAREGDDDFAGLFLIFV